MYKLSIFERSLNAIFSFVRDNLCEQALTGIKEIGRILIR
jgi:hypothetical protein